MSQCRPSRPPDNAFLLAEPRLLTLPCITGPRPPVHAVMSPSHLTCPPHPNLLVPRTLNPLTPPPAFRRFLLLPPAHLQSIHHPLLSSTPSATPHRQPVTTTPLHPRARLTMIPLFNPSFPQPFDIIAMTIMQSQSRHPQCTPPHSPVSPQPHPHFHKPS